MKYLIVFTALVLSASALPTYVGEGIASNGTRANERQMGFSTFGSGTRGGTGGAVWTVWDGWALRDALSGNDARIVYVRGRIDLTPLFTGSPGVIIVVGNFKSLIGGDGNAMIYGGGIKTYYGQQLIVENIKFHNALSYAPGEQPNGVGGIISMVPGAWSQVDAIDLEGTEHVYINHCEFADDPWVSHSTPNNMRRHDGQIDIKAGSSFITVANSIFRNHNLVSLIGHSDGNGAQDTGRLKITYHGNWFMGTTQRNPMVRYGEVHLLNNLYTDIIDYGIGVHTGALIYAERNVFINTRYAWAFPDTTPVPMGYLLNVNNMLTNSQFNTVPSDQIRWNPSQYYSYSPQAVNNVEWSVRNNAGTRW